MPGAIDKMRAEVMLPGMDDELSLILAAAIDEAADDSGPVDVDGFRKHTAATLEKRRPIAYSLIPKMVAEGMGVRGVCRVLNVSSHTISAVVVREQGSKTVSTWQAEFSKALRGNATLAVARISELLADDKAVRDAGLKGSVVVLREIVKALELVKDAEKNLPIDVSKSENADMADDYMKELEEGENRGEREREPGHKCPS